MPDHTLDDNADSTEAGFNDKIGDIEGYITAANRRPMLTFEREQELVRRYQQRGDQSAASELVESHLRLVVAAARGLNGYGLPKEDMIGEGNIGLIKALARFDPDVGARFATYALPWVRAEMQEYVIRNWRLVKSVTTKNHRKIFFKLRSFKSGVASMSEAQVCQLAEMLNVKPKEVRDMEVRMASHEVDLIGDTDEDGFAPIHYLTSDAYEPVNVLRGREIEEMQTSGLRDALDCLDPRARRIIEARWLDEEDTGRSARLSELASEFGVSTERIRQIELTAMRKMKQSLASYL